MKTNIRACRIHQAANGRYYITDDRLDGLDEHGRGFDTLVEARLTAIAMGYEELFYGWRP